MNLFNPKRRATRAELEQIFLPLDERALAQPEEAHLHARADIGLRLAGLGGELAAPDVDLFAQCEARRFLGRGLAARWTIECFDAFDSRLFSRRIKDDLVARRKAAAVDGSGDDAPVVAVFGELVDALDGHSKRPRGQRGPVLGTRRARRGRLVPGTTKDSARVRPGFRRESR